MHRAVEMDWEVSRGRSWAYRPTHEPTHTYGVSSYDGTTICKSTSPQAPGPQRIHQLQRSPFCPRPCRLLHGCRVWLYATRKLQCNCGTQSNMPVPSQ